MLTIILKTNSFGFEKKKIKMNIGIIVKKVTIILEEKIRLCIVPHFSH